MKVIVIYDESHCTIGIAADYYSAIHFLIQRHWITDNADVWDGNSEMWVSILDALGAKWKETLFDWDIEQFNDHFGEDNILLVEKEVIQYK